LRAGAGCACFGFACGEGDPFSLRTGEGDNFSGAGTEEGELSLGTTGGRGKYFFGGGEGEVLLPGSNVDLLLIE
jgi:hypothetical protein